jgi:hypothetical protein
MLTEAKETLVGEAAHAQRECITCLYHLKIQITPQLIKKNGQHLPNKGIVGAELKLQQKKKHI